MSLNQSKINLKAIGNGIIKIVIYHFYRYLLWIFFLLILVYSAQRVCYANCTIKTPQEHFTKKLNDPISDLLNSASLCPDNILAFRETLKNNGLKVQTTMVANRGYHNQTQGSYSFFGIVTGRLGVKALNPGDFYFGHFTTVNNDGKLDLDQGKSNLPRLLIEAFAWDAISESYHFYELVGNGEKNQWFYRGDSADIDADNQYLYRQIDRNNPQFGNHLRCSACHMTGGPIMKEATRPYNDWWMPNRQLKFGERQTTAAFQAVVEKLVPAQVLANSVIKGIQKIQNSKIFKSPNVVNLQQTLRPLFCTVEINLQSDVHVNGEAEDDVEIPLEFFISKPFTKHSSAQRIKITRASYHWALLKNKSSFPGTMRSDADHAWLTPVKGVGDYLAISHLHDIGLIDSRFILSVLSIDMFNPLFSDKRCQLLKYIPEARSNYWQLSFIERLKTSNDAAARELYKKLISPSYSARYYQNKIEHFVKDCRKKLKSKKNVNRLFQLLLQRRFEIKMSEISKNPRGKILEPGFKVIFPEVSESNSAYGWALTEHCDVIRKNL